MKALRDILLVLSLTVLGVVGWRFAVHHPSSPAATSPAAVVPPAAVAPPVAVATPTAPPPRSAANPTPAPAALVPAPALKTDDRLPEAPEFASFYGRLKGEFPKDYATLLVQVGTRDPATTADAAIWDAMRDLQQSQGILAAQAGPTVLDRYFDARRSLLDGFPSTNAQGCVDFIYGTVTGSSMAAFTAAHRGLVAALADRQVEVIEDGKLRHIERDAPTPDDLDVLSAALAARQVTRDEIGLLIDGTTPDPPVPDARLCALGQTYLDVIRGLPDPVRQRIYGLAATLLARS